VLRAHTDEDGTITWVDGIYIEQAIAPDDSQKFVLPDFPAAIQTLDLDTTITGPRLIDWSGTVPEITLHGYSR